MSIYLRAGMLALLGLSAYAPLASSQTIEIFAGTGHLRDVPGPNVAASPRAAVLGPDGLVYVATAQGKVLQLNPLLGTVTSLPAVNGKRDFKVGYSHAMAFSPTGELFIHADDALSRLDLVSGTQELLPPLPNETSTLSTMAFGADGTLYYPSVLTNTIRARLPDGTIITVAGLGGAGAFSGDGGPATNARFNWPMAVTLDPSGNLYIADNGNRRIRKITAATGIITTIAGGATSDMTAENLPALAAFMCSVKALSFDSVGNLYYVDSCLNKVRRVTAATGLINTVAGNGVLGTAGDGGPATSAQIGMTESVVVDAGGNVYLPDPIDNRMRMVSGATGIITTILGNGTSTFCGDSGPARNVCLGYPEGLAINSNSALYIGDAGNHRLRVVSWDGTISTLVNFASFDPLGMDVNAGNNVFMASGPLNGITQVGQSGGVGRAAGTGVQGFTGDGGLATSAQVSYTSDVAIDSAGNVFFSDSGNHRIRRIDAATRIITTYAGNGLSTGPLGDGGLATSASLNFPGAITLDRAGNLLIVDGQHYRLRKIDKNTRIITTIAGNGDGSYVTSGNGGPATAASLGTKPVIAVDLAGNIIVGWTSKLRRINAANGFINDVPEPPGGLLTPEGVGIQVPLSMVFDNTGRLYVGDAVEQVVFRVTLPPIPPDTTPPVIQSNVSGTTGTNDWYRSDVQVGWTVSDPDSVVSSNSGCAASSVTVDTAGVTYTCSATSAGGTASKSVTIKRDVMAPVLTFGEGTPAANPANGVRAGPVTVPFDASDALSGVFSTSSANPLSITATGPAVTAQVVVTDFAGNSATFTTPAFNIDSSPPVVDSWVEGVHGTNGWYKGDAHLTWTVFDPETGITSKEGCDAVDVTTDTAGTTFTCSATSAGGTTTQSVTIRRDATLPTLAWSAPNPAPNAAGWNTTDVTFTFTTEDATSGIAGVSHVGPGPVVVPFDGPGVTTQVTVWDEAGNSATVLTPPVNIDRFAPIVNYFVSGTAGTNGWYTSDVQVVWQVVKAPENILARTGCDNSTVTSDTAGTTFSCVVTSGAGTASSSVTIKRDATAPVLTFGTITPAANANGWNKTNLSVPFTRSDAMSGLATTSATSPLTLNTEGAGITRPVTVVDLAGNSVTFTSAPRNIDKTAPYAEMETPEDNATYSFYSDVAADFVCEDLSLMSCTAPVAQGAFINTTSAGSKTFKVTAKDLAGFTTTHMHAYSVASGFNFDGFLSPVRAPNTLNGVTAGSLVPMRWRLPDGRGGFVSNPAAFVSATVSTITCSGSTVTLGDSASGVAGLNFDAASGTFAYNWATTAGSTGCRKLIIKLKDSSTHELRFRFQ